MQRIFELDAAVPDADPGIGLLRRGLEVTAIDGTTMELARNGVLEGEFGTPAERARPLLRITAHVRTATVRWIGAAVGGYHYGENALADQLQDSFTPGIRTRRRRDTGDRQAERLPDTAARLVSLTVTARTRGGRVKTTVMRVLATLLDHAAHPAADIAVLYAER